MIKLSQSISEIIPDGSNPQTMTEFLTAMKLCIEELARKAKSIQTEVKSSAPSSVDEFDAEGEDVRMVSGATIRTYSLIDGSIRYHAET